MTGRPLPVTLPPALAGVAPPGSACCLCGRPATLDAHGALFCGAADCYEAYVAAATAHPCCGEG